jgi:transposase-like protein
MTMASVPDCLEQLGRWFPTEEACANLLGCLRWPKGFRCPGCGSPEAWWVGERRVFRCSRCDAQTSVTAGTIFQGTRKPLRAWFAAMWRVATEQGGVSALEIQQVLGLGSYHTAWAWLHKLRCAMVGTVSAVLTGTVAAGEGRLGTGWSRGRGAAAAERPLVFAAVQDNGGRPGRVRLRVEYVQRLLAELGLDKQRVMLHQLPGSARQDLALNEPGCRSDGPATADASLAQRVRAVRDAVVAAATALPPSPFRATAGSAEARLQVPTGQPRHAESPPAATDTARPSAACRPPRKPWSPSSTCPA